jgi:hypothetical protein
LRGIFASLPCEKDSCKDFKVGIGLKNRFGFEGDDEPKCPDHRCDFALPATVDRSGHMDVRCVEAA